MNLDLLSKSPWNHPFYRKFGLKYLGSMKITHLVQLEMTHYLLKLGTLIESDYFSFPYELFCRFQSYL